MKKKARLIAKIVPSILVLMGMVFSSLPAQASDSPQVVVQSRSGLNAGTLVDGRLIAQGRVSYSGPHLGFRVWSDDMPNGQANRYRLMSVRGKPLDIRLVGKGWQPDSDTGKGIVIRTEALSQTFDVEVDGIQTLPVDNWILKFNGVVLFH